MTRRKSMKERVKERMKERKAKKREREKMKEKEKKKAMRRARIWDTNKAQEVLHSERQLCLSSPTFQ